MWLLAPFGNSFTTALAVFGKNGRITVVSVSLKHVKTFLKLFSGPGKQNNLKILSGHTESTDP
jgi:hypothetical protein